MRARLSFLVFVLALTGCAHASGTTLPSYVWYDGNQAREVWLDPSLVAEFGANAQTPDALRSAGVRARPQAASGGVRLWRLSDGPRPDALARRLTGVVGTAAFSPVLRDSPASSSRLRALPGNIIVYFDPTWDMATIGRWLSDHNLQLIKPLPIRRNAFLIKTAPGLEALNTANALYRSGEVVAAFPDWWQAVAPR